MTSRPAGAYRHRRALITVEADRRTRARYRLRPMRVRRTFALVLLGAACRAGCGSSSSSSSSPPSSPALRTPPPPRARRANSSSSDGQAQSASRASRSSRARTLAPASTTQTGTVDGIQCGADRAARLPHPRAPGRCTSTAQPRALPGGIGIPGSQVVADHARARSRRAASASTGCTPTRPTA